VVAIVNMYWQVFDLHAVVISKVFANQPALNYALLGFTGDNKNNNNF